MADALRADAEYLADHRIPDVLEQLAFAILKEKPADHAQFAKIWLSNLRIKMQNNHVARAHGINLCSIDGNRLIKKGVNFSAPAAAGHQHQAASDGPDLPSHSRSTSKADRDRSTSPSSRNPNTASAAGGLSRWSHLAGSVEGSRRSKSAKALRELVDQLDLEDHPEAYKLLHDLLEARNKKNNAAASDGDAAGADEPNAFMKSVSAAAVMKSAGRNAAKNATADPKDNSASTDMYNQSTSMGGERRRIAVSAAPIEFAKVAGFRPKEIPKSDEIMATLREIVGSTTLFASFEAEEREVVIKAMHQEEFPSGHSILSQGEPGKDTFYLITGGTAEVIKDGKVVAALTAGQFFGELELMYNVPSCAATVRTVTQLETFALEKETYQNIVLHNTLARRETFLAHINKVPFLKDTSEYDKMQLADALAVGTYQKDDYLIRRGEANQWMFFLMDGAATIIGRDGDGKRVEIATVGPGDVVGELEFLFNHNAVADVCVSSTTLKVAKLNRKHFEMCMGPVADNLKEYVAQGNYGNYLAQANEEVKTDLEEADKRRKLKKTVSTVGDVRGGAGGAASLDASGIHGAALANTMNFAELGEIVFGGNQSVFRFPLEATNAAGLGMVAITEDGTVVFWGDVMARVTQYKPEYVVGQSIFSFLTQQGDQRKLHDLIKSARKWAGNWSGFCATGNYKRDLITFTLSSGLAKAQFSLSVIPPMVAQPPNRAEVFIIVGQEVKRKGAGGSAGSGKVDFGKWLVGSLEPKISTLLDLSKTPEASRAALVDEIERCLELVQSYEALAAVDTAAVTESWLPVDLHVMMNRYITELSSEARAANNHLNVQVQPLPDDEVFMDVAKLPDAITYLARNASRNNSGINISIRVDVLDDRDAVLDLANPAAFTSLAITGKKIRFVVEDDGAGLKDELLHAVMGRRESEHAPAAAGHAKRVTIQSHKGAGLRKIANTIAQMGGVFLITRGADGRGTRCAITLPLLLAPRAASSGESGGTPKNGADGARGAGATLANGRGFTTVMVEHSALHRNMMCQHLWGRRHAVLPATSWREVVKLVDGGNADILIVDPDYLTDELMSNTGVSMAEFKDPVDILNKYSKRMAIIMTSESYDVDELPGLEQRGCIALPKPCSAALLQAAIARAEAIVSKIREDEERISQLRETFSQTSRGAHKVVRLLGKGAFGEVYEVEDVLTKGHMAMKQLRVKSEAMADELVEEIRAMTTLKHENIIHYFYCEKVDAGNLKIFMELAEGGTLQDRIKGGKGMPLPEMARVLRDVLRGVEYIHERGYVHRDLKTPNALQTSDGHVKLGDFGTARHLKPGEKLYEMVGTLAYMSPECMNADPEEKLGYDHKTDIWSLGCIALELATGRPPFAHLPQCAGMGVLRYISELDDTPDLSPLFDMSPLIFEFVKACLEVDPTKRPSAKELLNFALFSDDDLAAGGGGGESRVATKLLQRAKLLHVLNKFVAFQEPVDDDNSWQRQGGGGGGGDTGGEQLRRSSRAADGGGNMFRMMTQHNFFDSDDDDAAGDSASRRESRESDSRANSGSSVRSPPGTEVQARTHSEDAFFASSSEEEDADDRDDDDVSGGAAKPSKPPAPIDTTTAASRSQGDGSASTPTSATGWASVERKAGYAVFDGADPDHYFTI